MRSKRSSRLEKTSSLLEPLVKRLGIAGGVRLAKLRSDWDKLFDKPLSVHMWPANLSDSDLLLNVDSPIWLHQLSFLKKTILDKLRGYGVKEIRFRVGRISRTGKTESEQRARFPLSDDEAAFISDLGSEINDEDLRSIIRGAAEKSLRAKPHAKKESR